MKKQVCGIYMIQNNIDKKIYIGSSYDIGTRFKNHISRLKNNKHKNQYLQNAVNKYGLSFFTFSIIEECLEEELIIKEQKHIDNYDWNELYNLTKVAYGGGADVLEIPLYLLDLKGEIIKEYKSGSELAKDLDRSIAPYSTINTKSILKTKYRIVSKEYYNTNLETIKSWRKYSNESKYKKELNLIPLFKVTKDDQEYNCFTLKEVGDILNVTHEAVRQMMKNKNVKVHKKTGFTIASVRKKDYLCQT
jgi:group I intron endonuclease